MEKEFNTPRKPTQNEENFRSLMSAASSRKAKISNIKGNAFGDCSTTYRTFNYQPMVSIMPESIAQQQIPPNDEQMRLNNQLLQVEQNVSRLNQEQQFREQQRQILLQKIIQKKTQLRAQRKQKLFKGSRLIEATKQTNRIREWLCKVEADRMSALQQRSTILQTTDDKIYKINRLIFNGEQSLKNLQEQTKMLTKREAAVDEQRLKQNVVNKQLREELRDLQEKNAEVVRELEEAEKNSSELGLQISILKMQLSPYLRISFECAAWGGSATKGMILNKDPNIWEQKKTKALTKEDIKNYVIMQLYPNWKRIVNHVSFNFSGFKMIFFEKGKIEDLMLIADSNSQKKTKSASRSLIVFYSTYAQSYEDLKSLFTELIGQGNDILKISKLNFSKQSQDIEDMTIDYTFKEEERDKVFRLIKIKELARQAISPFLTKEEDKTVLIKIEVPLNFSQQGQKLKAEEVYKMLERYM